MNNLSECTVKDALLKKPTDVRRDLVLLGWERPCSSRNISQQSSGESDVWSFECCTCRLNLYRSTARPPNSCSRSHRGCLSSEVDSTWSTRSVSAMIATPYWRRRSHSWDHRKDDVASPFRFPTPLLRTATTTAWMSMTYSLKMMWMGDTANNKK